jgi:hypothetical protein
LVTFLFIDIYLVLGAENPPTTIFDVTIQPKTPIHTNYDPKKTEACFFVNGIEEAELILIVNHNYTFYMDHNYAASYPFIIEVASGDSMVLWNLGVDNQAANAHESLIFVPPVNTPAQLEYGTLTLSSYFGNSFLSHTRMNEFIFFFIRRKDLDCPRAL